MQRELGSLASTNQQGQEAAQALRAKLSDVDSKRASLDLQNAELKGQLQNSQQKVEQLETDLAKEREGRHASELEV